MPQGGTGEAGRDRTPQSTPDTGQHQRPYGCAVVGQPGIALQDLPRESTRGCEAVQGGQDGARDHKVAPPIEKF